MAVWAIGDLQGCLAPLESLLAKIRFDPDTDRLWCVGDLVNRGPESLACLRRIRELGDAAVMVLGNHDLHLLAVACGVDRRKHADTLDDILDAPDRDALLDWLAHRPLLHRDRRLEWTLVHAGLPPGWDLDLAERLAGEVETALQSDPSAFFREMYGDRPERWDPDLEGPERLRFIVNALTRLRFVRSDGSLDLAAKGPPAEAPPGTLPWFEYPTRRSRGERIVFGHWSTLGYHRGEGVLSLDTGCVWGGALTAARLDGEEPEAVHVPCPDYCTPG